MGSPAPLLSASGIFSFGNVYAYSGFVFFIVVVIVGAITRFIFVAKHRRDPGVGFTQRQRYRNEVRVRREIAEQLAREAQDSSEEGEPPPAEPAT